MPEFTSRDLGGVNDAVTLRLNGETLLVAESYDVRMSFFRQPSVFALRTGWGGTALELAERFPPNSRFELLIADRTQFTGRIDAVNMEQSVGGTEVTFHGRDDLALLHDSKASADRSFDDASYDDLVSYCLTDAGIADFTLIFNNANNRTRKTGVDVTTPTNSAVFGRASTRGTSKKKKAGQLKVGTQLFGFCKQELDRGGLFLFADADTGNGPTFVLTEPNTIQPAAYRVVRRRDLLRNQVNVVSASKKNDISKRYTEYIVYGRGGDPKTGQQPIVGTYIDNEMLGNYGFSRGQKRNVTRVDSVQNTAEANDLAWRMRADDRRDGYGVTYVVSGHTVPALNGRTSNDRAVWSFDTVVDVDDDEYGIHGPMYLSDVQFQRDGGGTRTTLTLIDSEDWVAP
jgi:prophage tail gpP-like protein